MIFQISCHRKLLTIKLEYKAIIYKIVDLWRM